MALSGRLRKPVSHRKRASLFTDAIPPLPPLPKMRGIETVHEPDVSSTLVSSAPHDDPLPPLLDSPSPMIPSLFLEDVKCFIRNTLAVKLNYSGSRRESFKFNRSRGSCRSYPSSCRNLCAVKETQNSVRALCGGCIQRCACARVKKTKNETKTRRGRRRRRGSGKGM